MIATKGERLSRKGCPRYRSRHEYAQLRGPAPWVLLTGVVSSSSVALLQGEALEKMQMAVEQRQKDFAALQARINEAELAKDMAIAGGLAQGPLQMTNEQVGLAQEIGSLMRASRGGNEHVCPRPFSAACVTKRIANTCGLFFNPQSLL